MAKLKELALAAWAKIKAVWATKIGKIAIIVVVALGIAIPSGGIGSLVGCLKQKVKTDAVKEELKDTEKDLKAVTAEKDKAVKEKAKLQEELDKKDKKKKKKK